VTRWFRDEWVAAYIADASEKPTTRQSARAIVAGWVALSSRPDGTRALLSTLDMARIGGLSRWTIMRAVKELKEQGWLAVTERGHRRGDGSVTATVYELAIPDALRSTFEQPRDESVSSSLEPHRDSALSRSQGTRREFSKSQTGVSKSHQGATPPTYPLDKSARAAGFTAEERKAVKAEIRRRKGPDASSALLAHCFKEDGADILAELKAKAAVNTALAEAEQSPKCPHDEPGGDRLHPVSGEPLCLVCRVAWRQQQPGYRRTQPWEA
jgi:DNA-binding transcriptional regulator YhcF (GntR family)